MSSANPDPRLFTLATRVVALRWSNRAAYRLDTLQPRPALEQAREGDGYAFLVAHLWAMLHDERDRRRWPAPEDFSSEVDPGSEQLKDLWQHVFLTAYGVDLTAPAPTPVGTAPAESPGGDPANPSLGSAP